MKHGGSNQQVREKVCRQLVESLFWVDRAGHHTEGRPFNYTETWPIFVNVTFVEHHIGWWVCSFTSSILHLPPPLHLVSPVCLPRLHVVLLPCATSVLSEVQKMSDCVEEEEDGAESAVSSCLSMKSDWSKEYPPDFSKEPGPLDTQ